MRPALHIIGIVLTSITFAPEPATNSTTLPPSQHTNMADTDYNSQQHKHPSSPEY